MLDKDGESGGGWVGPSAVALKLAGLAASGSPLGALLHGAGGMLDDVMMRRSQRKLVGTLPEGAPERGLADVYAKQMLLTPERYQTLLQMGRENRALPVVAQLHEPVSETRSFERLPRPMEIGPESSPVPPPPSVTFAPPPEVFTWRRRPLEAEGYDRLLAAMKEAPDELTRSTLVRLGLPAIRSLGADVDKPQDVKDAEERAALAPALLSSGRFPGPLEAEAAARAATTGTTARGGLALLMPPSERERLVTSRLARQEASTEEFERRLAAGLEGKEGGLSLKTDADFLRAEEEAVAHGVDPRLQARLSATRFARERQKKEALETSVRTELIPRLEEQHRALYSNPLVTAEEREFLGGRLADLDRDASPARVAEVQRDFKVLAAALPKRQQWEREFEARERQRTEVSTRADNYLNLARQRYDRGDVAMAAQDAQRAINGMRAEQRILDMRIKDPLTPSGRKREAEDRYEALQRVIEETELLRSSGVSRGTGQPAPPPGPQTPKTGEAGTRSFDDELLKALGVGRAK